MINIVTRTAAETLGPSAEGGGGTKLRGSGAVRDGASPSGLSFRLYGHRFGRSSTVRSEGGDAVDAWGLGQGGFRVDWNGGKADVLTLQSDYDDGRPDATAGETSLWRDHPDA